MGRKFKYSPEDKIQAAKDYLSGRKGTKEICSELGIRYNSNKGNIIRILARKYQELGEMSFYDKPHNKSYSSRLKIEAEERVEIVEYCINNERNYKEAADKYKVSYNQVYTWVKKYDSNGDAGLIDKRGHHKKDDEVDELERLRRDNNRLKRQLEEKDMVVELLKKVQEIERRRY